MPGGQHAPQALSLQTGSGLYDVIVLGSGPAGLTAAIYTSRARLKTLVVTGQMLGGQISFTYNVDNYPGFPEGVTGPDLVNLIALQAEKFGAKFLDEEATSVDFFKRPLVVKIGESEYQSEVVIIATGSNSRKLGLESEERLMGRGVFRCATCDAALYEGKRVIVVGGGDSALQEALDLAKFAEEVFIIHRRDELKACACLKRRAEENARIRFLYDEVVEDIIGDDHVEGVKIRNLRTDETRIMKVDGVLVAVGWDPNTSLFRGQVDMDDRGFITSPNGVDTSVDGVYVCGDLLDEKYRQMITACGSGCKAALEAEKYIENLRTSS